MKKRRGAKRAFVVGVDLGGTNVRASAVLPDGGLIGSTAQPTEVAEGTGQVLANIKGVVEKVALRGKQEGREFAGVGVAVPGPLDSATGVVYDAPNFPEWKRFPLGRRLKKILPVPVFLDNDGNCAALGEQWLGAAAGCSHVIVLTLGTGVGGGLIVGGELVRGLAGFAGEVGHVIVSAGGAPCNCGGRGCLEAYSSATGLKRMLSDALPPGELARLLRPDGRLDVRAVAARARRGETRCKEVFARAARLLGVALASFVNLFNPEVIVLGGGMAGAWGLIAPLARAEMRRRAFPGPARQVRLVRAGLGARAGVIGAAKVALIGLAG